MSMFEYGPVIYSKSACFASASTAGGLQLVAQAESVLRQGHHPPRRVPHTGEAPSYVVKRYYVVPLYYLHTFHLHTLPISSQMAELHPADGREAYRSS